MADVADDGFFSSLGQVSVDLFGSAGQAYILNRIGKPPPPGGAVASGQSTPISSTANPSTASKTTSAKAGEIVTSPYTWLAVAGIVLVVWLIKRK